MEPKFQTSFIPKKPITPSGVNIPAFQKPKTAGTSIFMTIGIFLFILSLVSIGGAYLWKQYLLGAQDSYKQQLADREKQFNTSEIEDLKKVNVQIDTARSLLAQHLALSGIFNIIGNFTIQSVRFVSVDITGPGSPGDAVKLAMTGYGTNFTALAFQSQVLGSLEKYGLKDVVKNPIIADPTVDQASGGVKFGFNATVDPSTLSYEYLLTGATSTPH